MSQQDLRFDGRVVVITGAGGSLGRNYALEFARRGAKVVVNDLGGTAQGAGSDQRAADTVVEEIREAGGNAIANYDSVDNGEIIIRSAIETYGRIDILINNAGILRDSSFKKMSQEDWDLVQQVHCHGAFKLTHAAWAAMQEQKFGRIINTSSAAGLYGNFGQANYSAAKMALVGLTKTLAVEGERNGVFSNVIAPAAGSRLTESLFPEAITNAMKPEFITPLVVSLCHEGSQENGSIFEVGAGWIGKLRWQRSAGVSFDTDSVVTPEMVMNSWSNICDFTKFDTPENTIDSSAPMLRNIGITQ